MNAPFLATRPFKDGQCYPINDGKISTSRQSEFSKSPADPQGADLWCQSDIRLPRDVSILYTLYWVWEWPFKPSDTQQPADIHTSCIDIYIVPQEVGFQPGQGLNEMGFKKQMLAAGAGEQSRAPHYPTEPQLSSILHQAQSSPDDGGDLGKLLTSFTKLMMKLMDKEKVEDAVAGLTHPDRWSHEAINLFTGTASKSSVEELLGHPFMRKKERKDLVWLVHHVLIRAHHMRYQRGSSPVQAPAPFFYLSFILTIRALLFPTSLGFHQTHHDRPQEEAQAGATPEELHGTARGHQVPASIVNNDSVPKNVEHVTKRKYARQLQNWDDFVQKHGYQSVNSLQHLKVRIGKAMRTNMRPEEPLSYQGIISYWKDVTAGFNRERGTIPKDDISFVTRLLGPRGELDKLLNIVADKGPRHLPLPSWG
ncbi:hypothetical protein FALBO_5581 [Fusarium albosuccineum]|uniref:DUF7492 domain-containing protein n=1 Tax=Fusarium albosuccineum TaxID=1237068 RepID=A0A8H4LDS9_9HYPO|nr:hypothetical protein FALBO_5581 [Fusarium albosuccineum]